MDKPTRSLCFMYQSSDRYALPTGVSLASLLENNADSEIHPYIYLLSDDISESNLEALRGICSSYDAELHVVPIKDILRKGGVYELGLPPWNNSLVIYSKLFAIEQIDFPCDTVVYIDGDTLVNKPLDELAEIGEELYLSGNAIAACYDFYISEFKEIYGVDRHEAFFNTGLMVISKSNWMKKRCLDRIVDHVCNVRAKYITADQDIINMVFRDEIQLLDPTFNFNSGFYLYGIDDYLDMYGLSDIDIVDKKRLHDIMEQGPHINHCMINMCGRPWELANKHPQNSLFDRYLKLTSWSNEDKFEANKTLAARIQYAMFNVLPRPLYKKIYPRMTMAYFRRLNRAYLNS